MVLYDFRLSDKNNVYSKTPSRFSVNNQILYFLAQVTDIAIDASWCVYSFLPWFTFFTALTDQKNVENELNTQAGIHGNEQTRFI